jgi:hypothetical protein
MAQSSLKRLFHCPRVTIGVNKNPRNAFQKRFVLFKLCVKLGCLAVDKVEEVRF